MGPIGWQELILILIVVLVIFGPGKLPDVGNAIGKGIREFRRASNDLEESVRGEPRRGEARRSEPARVTAAEAPAPAAPAPAARQDAPETQ